MILNSIFIKFNKTTLTLFHETYFQDKQGGLKNYPGKALAYHSTLSTEPLSHHYLSAVQRCFHVSMILTTFQCSRFMKFFHQQSDGRIGYGAHGR